MLFLKRFWYTVYIHWSNQIYYIGCEKSRFIPLLSSRLYITIEFKVIDSIHIDQSTLWQTYQPCTTWISSGFLTRTGFCAEN